MDADNSLRERRIRIKDHGSSAMRGEFFIVITIIDEDADSEGKCDSGRDGANASATYIEAGFSSVMTIIFR